MAKQPKKKRGSSGDPLRVQISIQARVPRGYKVSREFLDEVIENWKDTGDLPEGIKIKAVHFQNPGRTKPTAKYSSPADWRFATTKSQIERARTSLNLRGLLQPGAYDIQTVGTPKRREPSAKADVGLRRRKTTKPKKNRGNARSGKPASKKPARRSNKTRSSRSNRRKPKS